MLPGLFQGLIQLCESQLGKEHLTSYLQHIRDICSPQPMRYAADGGDVSGDVLPHPSIPPGGSLREAPVEIGEVHRHPVDLQLAQIVLGWHPGQPRGQFGLVENVVEAQHPLPVGDGGELGHARIGNPRGGGTRAPQFGVTILQAREFLEPFVVLGVGDDGLDTPVVGIAGGQEKLVEFLPAVFGFGGNRHGPMLSQSPHGE